MNGQCFSDLKFGDSLLTMFGFRQKLE